MMNQHQGGPAPIIIVKKKKQVHAHHGGAWKVAYADFVTAMMALFIVLWLLAQSDQTMREALSEYFRTGVFSGAPSVLNGGSGLQNRGFLEPDAEIPNPIEQEALERAAKMVKADLEALVASSPDLKGLPEQIQVTVTEQGLLVQIIDGGEDVIFDLSSAELKPPLVKFLQALAPTLGKLKNQLQIHGHTDARPFPEGSKRTNWELSFERANKAREFLQKNGVRDGQITGVFAHGPNAPLIEEDPFAAANRRLAILAVRKGFEKDVARGIKEEKPAM